MGPSNYIQWSKFIDLIIANLDIIVHNMIIAIWINFSDKLKCYFLYFSNIIESLIGHFSIIFIAVLSLTVFFI